MGDQIFGIDKGIIRAFGLTVVVVGILTTFFLSEYVAAIILGSVYHISNNGSTITETAVTAESFQANNVTEQFLTNTPLLDGTLLVYNASTNFALANFTIHNVNGSILLKGGSEIKNGSTLLANYTYYTETTTDLPTTADTKTFLGSAEDDFVTSYTSINTAVKFAATLITVVAVILVFASFLPKRNKRDDMGY